MTATDAHELAKSVERRIALRRIAQLEREVERLGNIIAAQTDRVAQRSAALDAIRIYASGDHKVMGKACGVDVCVGCLIHGTAHAALG